MNKNFSAALAEICDLLASQTLPRWQELPDLELYMDQVLALINRYLGGYPGFDNKGLTASMVNNYVKMGVMPPPTQKKYNRTHLSRLIIICILKSTLPISSIQMLIDCEPESTEEEMFYDRFCDLFESTDLAVASSERELLNAGGMDISPLDSIYYAALRAQAEQMLATRLFSALFPASVKQSAAD